MNHDVQEGGPADEVPPQGMTNAQLAMALRNNLSLVGSREKLRELIAAAAARLVASPEIAP